MPFTVLSGAPTGTNEESQDSAIKIGNPEIFNLPAPASLTGASNTATATQLINGIILVNNATATTLTMPPAQGATGLAAALRPYSSRGLVVGDSIYVYVGAGGAGTVTLSVSGATGMTFDTNAGTTIVTGSSRLIIFRCTNGTPGSEAFTLFT